MKRVLSLVLALVLVLGTILPVFAEEVTTSGEQLKALGVIEGTENGLDEDQPLTRAQAAVVLSEMYGKKDEAAAYAFPASFTDVEEGQWYTPYIAYAEAQGWMSGDGEGLTFRPNDTMTAQELNAMYLVVLGYTVEWAEVNAEATTLEFAVDAADATLVLRGEAFTAILAALDVMPMDEEATLGTKLALEGYVAPTPPAPEALEVVTVKALNLIQVEVVFNQEVDADSAEDAGNYDVEDMTITDAALQADMMTVVLTLTANADQQDALDVTVDAVETAEELALEEVVFEDVAFLDTTIPTAISAEVVGIDTIKVTFSEPMTTATLVKANFSVDGGDLYINTVTPMNNNMEANITLYSDLEEGDVDVKVKAAIEDEAGFGVVQDTLTATVTEDADAPVVVAFKDATTTAVTLVFSEEIEVGTLTAANFYHTNSNNPIDADIVVADDLSSDGKELTLAFTTNELPEGTAYVYVLKDTVNDLWDNDNTQIMFKVEITVDVTAPEVDSVKVKTEEQIQVKFTEAVDADMAEDMDNYTILDEDGEEVEDIIDDINYAAKVATIDFNDTLSGDYTVVVKNVEDPAENEMATATVEFSVDDLTAPVFTDFAATLYNPGSDNQMIRITFGESMNTEGNYSVVDPANYTINGNSLSDLVDDYDAEIALTDNGKAIQITVVEDDPATATVTEGVTFATGATAIAIARVADASDNYTAAFNGTIEIVAAATVDIAKVQVTAVDTVVVTFDDLLEEFDATDLVVTTDDSSAANAFANLLPLAKRSISMNSDGNTVVTLTLVTDLTFDALSVAAPVYAYVIDLDAAGNASTISSVNEFGEKLALNDKLVAADKVAAELFDNGVAAIAVGADLKDYLVINNDDTFLVAFTEVMATLADYTLAGNDFVVKADNDTLVNGVDFEVTGIAASGITGIAAGNTAFTFTLLGDYLGFDGDIEVALAAETNFVTDVAGNDLDAIETGEFAVENVPTVKTQVVAAAAGIAADTTHTLVFNEALNAATQITVKAAVDAAYTVNAGVNTTVEATVTSAWNTAGTTLTVTIDIEGDDDVDLGAIANTVATDANGFGTAALDLQQ